MESVLALVLEQIVDTYNPNVIKDIFCSETNTKVLQVIGGLRMEFTSDEDAINVFTILATNIPSRKTSSKKLPKSTTDDGATSSQTQPDFTTEDCKISSQRQLNFTTDDGTTYSGHYTHHAGMMHTHFRFSSTRDDILKLLKLVDYSIYRMVMTTSALD